MTRMINLSIYGVSKMMSTSAKERRMSGSARERQMTLRSVKNCCYRHLSRHVAAPKSRMQLMATSGL